MNTVQCIFFQLFLLEYLISRFDWNSNLLRYSSKITQHNRIQVTTCIKIHLYQTWRMLLTLTSFFNFIHYYYLRFDELHRWSSLIKRLDQNICHNWSSVLGIDDSSLIYSLTNNHHSKNLWLNSQLEYACMMLNPGISKLLYCK